MRTVTIGDNSYNLTDPVTVIGRGDQADLQVESTKLSRLHVRVLIEGDSISLEDLGSKNGTFVNGSKITEKVTLKKDDNVTIADLQAVFTFPEVQKPAGTPVTKNGKKKNGSITPGQKAEREAQKLNAKKSAQRKKNIQITAAAVCAVIILGVLIFMGSKQPEGLEQARAVIGRAEAELDGITVSDDMTVNTESLEALETIRYSLTSIPQEFRSEYSKAQALRERAASVKGRIEKRNDELTAVQTAAKRYMELTAQIDEGRLTPLQSLGELKQYRSVFANAPEAGLALEKIYEIERTIKTAEKNTVRKARQDASTRLLNKGYTDALALLDAAINTEYSRLGQDDLAPLKEKREEVVTALKEDFSDTVKKTVRSAKTGDCEQLKTELTAAYEKINYPALKGELDQALELISSVQDERLAAARLQIEKELAEVPRLLDCRMYGKVVALYNQALGGIEEPELKRTIEEKLVRVKLNAVAKTFVIRYVNEKNGVDIEGLGFVKEMKPETFTLEMDGMAMPLPWDKISDEEFGLLFDLASIHYSDPELLVACAVNLIDRGSIIAAGNYLKRAKAIKADIDTKYPEIFSSCLSRVAEIKKKQEVEKKEQVKRLAALKQRRANIKPGMHPMLYFGPQELAGLTQTVKSGPFSPRWAKLIKVADGHIKGPVRGTRNYREALGVIGTSSFAYAITKDKKYADRAKKETWALLKANQWHTVRHYNKGADLETAEASLACGLFYDWCYDALSSEDRAYFKERALKLGVRVYLSSIEKHRDWWMDNYVTNWCGVCHGGPGVLALSLYDESDEAKKAVDYAWKHTIEFLKEVSLEDGGGHEGVMYHNYGFSFGLFFAVAGERFFGTDNGLFNDLIASKAGYWNCYMQDQWGWFANFNDMGEQTGYGLLGANHRQWGGGPSAVVCALIESRMQGGDPLLLWAADNGGHAFYYEGISPFYFLFRRRGPSAIPHTEKPKLAPAVLFKGAGHVVFQSPIIWMAYNGGWTSNKSHSNRDLGTFVLSCGGERMVSDPGYGANETKDHATYLINGTGQPRDVRGTFTRFGSGKQFHYFSSDLSKCYPDTTLRSLVRNGVMVRGQYMVFLDSMTSSSDSTFEFRIPTRKKVEVDSESRKATLTGAKKLFILNPSPVDSVFRKGGKTGAPKQGGACTFLSVKTPGKQKTAVFITVFYPEEAGPCPSAAIEMSGGGGTLKIAHKGGTDTLKFSLSAAGLTLGSVNGESASKIRKPSGTTVPQAR